MAIIDQRLSPLYISVHNNLPGRAVMLGNSGIRLMEDFSHTKTGIQLHQVVGCRRVSMTEIILIEPSKIFSSSSVASSRSCLSV